MLKQLLAERAYILSQELDYLAEHKSHGDEVAGASSRSPGAPNRSAKRSALQPPAGPGREERGVLQDLRGGRGPDDLSPGKEAVALSLTQSGPRRTS